MKVLRREEMNNKLPEVKEVSLLTLQEVNDYGLYIEYATGDSFFGEGPKIPSYFYLKDAFDDHKVYIGNGDGGDYDYDDVDWEDVEPSGQGSLPFGTGTRPAIRFVEPIPEVRAGDKIAIRGDYFTVLAPDLLLSDMYISRRKYDAKSSEYENSEIKKRIDAWYAELCEDDEFQSMFEKKRP